MVDIRFFAQSLWRDVNMIHSDFLSLERLMRSVGRRFVGLIHVPQTGEATNDSVPVSGVREGSLSGL